MINNQLTDSRGSSLVQYAFNSIGMLFRSQPVHDFGVDAHIEIIENERPTGQLIGIQLKSGKSYFKEEKPQGYFLRSDDVHVSYWIKHSLPIIVVICDPDEKIILWEHVNESTVEDTGDRWKILVPKKNRLDTASAPVIKDLATKIVSDKRYTVLNLQDSSHGLAKRYALHILINGSATKAEIAVIVRKTIGEHVNRQYYRDSIAEEYWKGKDAHVILAFVYISLEDYQQHNWVCRAIWVDENLDPAYAQFRFDGEDVGNSVIVDWSKNYNVGAYLIANYSVTKESYLKQADSITRDLSRVFDDFKSHLDRNTIIDVNDSVLLKKIRSLLSEVDIIEQRNRGIGIPPVECGDLHKKIQLVVAILGNIALICSPTGFLQWDEKSRKVMIGSYVQEGEKEFLRLEYEREKIS